MKCEVFHFCTVVGDVVDMFYSGGGQDVSDTLVVVPHCPVPFKVPDQCDGHCPSVALEAKNFPG